MKRKQLASLYRVAENKKFRLSDTDPGDTSKFEDKNDAQKWLEEGVARLSELQDLLYAQNQWSVLLIFQAMDAAGKDSTIKHVMSGVNPQGCQVFSFKAPSSEDLSHDYLWRSIRCLPERGRIGIFNRSYYEEMLVVRVHPEFLARQRIPPALVTEDIWKQRFQDVNNFERYLSRNGVLIRKFFLHVSKKEQKARFLSRLDQPEKNWKFSTADMQERQRWDEYTRAYQDMIAHTGTRHAPWYVVPADHKWFTRLVVAEVVVDALESLALSYPQVNTAKRKELAAVRRALLNAKR